MAGARIGQQILQNRLIAPIDVLLGALSHVDVAEAAGCPLHAEQGIKHKGIQSMVIPLVHPLIFGRKQNFFVYKLAEVELAAFFVVPVHHGGLAAYIHADKELAKVMDAAGYQFSSANSINIGRLVPQIV